MIAPLDPTENMVTEGSLFLPYRQMPDKLNYTMVIDLWTYADGSIGFSGRPNKKGCGCEQECGKLRKQISACFDSRPIKLATKLEYLAAREETLASGVVLPLPDDFLPALNPGEIVLLEQGLFLLGQDIELIPLTSEQKQELLRIHPGDNDRFIDYC